MIIRKLTPKDLYQSAGCAAQAFGGNIEPQDLEMPETKMLAAFDDDNETLFGQFEIIDFNNFFGKGKLKCAGIGGVATRAEHRRKGAVRALFNEFFTNGEYNYDISILYPFSTSYYRQFGYETSAPCMNATARFTEFSHIERNTDVELFDESKLPQILELYNRIAKKYNLCFERTNGNYFNCKPYYSLRYTYLWKNKEGKYGGYVSLTIDRLDELITVNEIMYENKEALLGILGFLRTFDGNQQKICFEKIPVDSPIVNLVQNEKHFERKVGNMGAVRVLNMKNVLKMKKFPVEKGSFTVEIHDVIKNNNGKFRIEYENKECNITDFYGETDVVLEPEGMSKIFLCGANEYEIPYMNGVKVNKDNPDFYRAFPVQNTFFVDGF